MKCIFCLQERPPSDEHVIPESVGGKLRIKEVCRECNSELSRVVDGPFASCPLIRLARFTHSLGGKRDKIPFPFTGIGTLDSGQRVSVDTDFVPHVKRTFSIEKLASGGLQFQFSADASDKDKFDQMLGEPLRKVLAAEFGDWSPEKLDEEVRLIVERARTQVSVSEHKPIRQQWTVGSEDLLFEFLKIAYEMWFLRFGYTWIETSATAGRLRDAVRKRDSSVPIRGQLLCPEVPLPESDPFRNHLIVQLNGGCVIRLFNITCAVECEESDEQFMLSEENAYVTMQDFLTGILTTEKLVEFVAKRLPPV